MIQQEVNIWNVTSNYSDRFEIVCELVLRMFLNDKAA